MRRNTAKQEQFNDMVARWRQRRAQREAWELEDRLKHLDRDLRIVLKRINQDNTIPAYGEEIPDVGAEVEMESFMSDEQRAAEEHAAEEHAAEEQRIAEEAQREYEEWQLADDEDRAQRAAEYNAFLDRMAARDA